MPHPRELRRVGDEVEHRARPRERLLRRPAVPLRQVLQWRLEPVALPQSRPARCDEQRPEERSERDAEGPPDVDGDAVGVGDGGERGEDHRAVAGHVVGDAEQPPRHSSARDVEVPCRRDPTFRPHPDPDHQQEVERERGVVEGVHESPPPGRPGWTSGVLPRIVRSWPRHPPVRASSAPAQPSGAVGSSTVVQPVAPATGSLPRDKRHGQDVRGCRHRPGPARVARARASELRCQRGQACGVLIARSREMRGKRLRSVG